MFFNLLRFYATDKPVVAAVSSVDTNIDYYELLHVQSSAPIPVIKASYRAMMQKMKHHPDKGGDAGFAQLLNEAESVLCNPNTRARYDALRKNGLKKNGQTKAQDGDAYWGEPGGSPAKDKSQSQPDNRSALQAFKHLVCSASVQCPFCQVRYANAEAGAAAQPAYKSAARCKRCNGATTPISQASLSNNDELRSLHRQSYDTPTRLWLQWPDELGNGASVTDFSPAGCALRGAEELKIGQTIMIETPLFNAICTVRHSQLERTGKWLSGLSFITLDMNPTPGTLLNATA